MFVQEGNKPVTDREYQEDFYTLYEDFRDEQLRLGKAEKSLRSLRGFSGRELSELNCLDIGCSNGIFTRYLATSFRSMTGIDYDRTAIFMVPEEDRERILFLRGDAMRMPFADESFDAVICAQVYEHVPNDLRLFAEMYRVLKPGGVAFFSGPNKVFPIEPHYYLPFLHWLPEKTADAYLRLLRKGTHFYERSRTPGNLRKVLRGFDIRDVTLPVLRLYAEQTQSRRARWAYRQASGLPVWLWRAFLLAWVPNFNWVLTKRVDPMAKQQYEVIP